MCTVFAIYSGLAWTATAAYRCLQAPRALGNLSRFPSACKPKAHKRKLEPA